MKRRLIVGRLRSYGIIFGVLAGAVACQRIVPAADDAAPPVGVIPAQQEAVAVSAPADDMGVVEARETVGADIREWLSGPLPNDFELRFHDGNMYSWPIEKKLVARGESELDGSTAECKLRCGRADAQDVEALWRSAPCSTLAELKTEAKRPCRDVDFDHGGPNVESLTIRARGRSMSFSDQGCRRSDLADWLRQVRTIKLKERSCPEVSERVCPTYPDKAVVGLELRWIKLSLPLSEQVLRFARLKNAQIRSCLQARVSKEQVGAFEDNRRGQAIRVVVAPSGQVRKVENLTWMPAFECAEAKVRRWKFPRTQDGFEAMIQYMVTVTCDNKSCVSGKYRTYISVM